MNENLKNFLSDKFGIINSDESINLARFFGTFHKAIAYSEAIEKYPLPNTRRLNVSKYNPCFDKYIDRYLFLYNKHQNKKQKTMSIKKMASLGLLFCPCGSNEFFDEHQYILCRGCKKVERKRNILINKNNTITIKSKNFQYAKRCRVLFTVLRQRMPSKQLRNFLERYAFKDYELEYIKLMRRNKKSRESLIKQYNLGVLTNQFSDKKRTELFNYDKPEYKLKAKVYSRELEKEGEIKA